MILKKNRYWICFIVGFVLTFGLGACGGKKKTILCELDKVIGQHVQLPNDTVFRDGHTKILILVEDTGDCSPCSMGINEWYIYHLDMEYRGLRGDIIYILKEGIHLPLSVDTILEQYGLYKYYDYGDLTEQNDFLQECGYSTFLISSDNSVLLVGSPLDEPKLWNVYRKALDEQMKEKGR